MTRDPQLLMDGYLDETLSSEEVDEFSDWLEQAPAHALRFAQRVMLHDDLRNVLLAAASLETATQPRVRPPASARQWRPIKRRVMSAGVAVAVTVVLVVVWKTITASPASAAEMALNRIIVASATTMDRTYRITVEEVIRPRVGGERTEPPDHGRPPKPPLDGAVLHVRSGNQFVLERKTVDGLPFVTGSDGQTSWAVRPDGPVRISSDLTRFNHDVPGHEHAMPLINIEEGLERVRVAYDVKLVPPTGGEATLLPQQEQLQTLVAVKRRGYRGPEQVEILYAVQSGQIRELRFVDMPYGPDLVTLRLSLVAEHDLGASYFDHAAHHAPDRVVVEE